jgi:hypothetical protein
MYRKNREYELWTDTKRGNIIKNERIKESQWICHLQARIVAAHTQLHKKRNTDSCSISEAMQKTHVVQKNKPKNKFEIISYEK